MLPTVRVVTDSCASIPDALLAEQHIIMVPYYVHIGAKSYRDLIDMPRDAFYEYLARATELPKTGTPSPGDYLSAYRRAAAEGAEAIVSVHMTSLGSGGYQTACIARDMARQEFPRLAVEVIDTRNVAMCQGWIALEAARAARQSAGLSEVMALVQQLIPRVRMIQTADTLRYLYMGGRIGRAQHLFGSLLNIKPLISMEDGIIVALGTARSRPGAYQAIVHKMADAIGQSRCKVAYLHAAALDEVRKLRTLLEARLQPVETLVAELSPALGVHTGVGTVGVCYLQLP